MEEELAYIGKEIVEQRHELANRIQAKEGKGFERNLVLANVSREQIDGWRATLFQYLGEALYGDYETIESQIEEWAIQTGDVASKYDVPLNEIIPTLGYCRTVIWNMFEKELAEDRFAAKTILHVSKLIDPLLDKVMHQLSQIYNKHHSEEWQKAQEKLMELSVPVVPITNGVAVLPIVGGIDTERAQLIMETSLEKSTKFQLQYLLIDISGVPAIDTSVAHYIFQVTHSLQLVGVETILTGIRPEIARSVVEMGMKFSKVKTRANLHQALNEIGVG
ncbi:STAS domain-containing protein [Halobacillus amylolyticus]|uniref:STAS domain-containing protein n=1 Tax=Halobacillus amylolyticus TaxID=2932259 RepID=A0ABY4H920_9BACI|nr:STAS domain-containing protein [Halobacillus amylolyticus]UOR11041.1 STAS domain-containing protein [Halobacillus amylolyticus]